MTGMDSENHSTDRKTELFELGTVVWEQDCEPCMAVREPWGLSCASCLDC